MREPNVTRTFKTLVLTVTGVVLADKAINTYEVEIPDRTMTQARLEMAVQKELPEGVKLITIDSQKEKKVLRGMSESDFLKNSKPMLKTTENDLEADSEDEQTA